MEKELKDFTIEEILNRALKGFGKIDPDKRAKFEDERNALYAVLNFKLAEKQSQAIDEQIGLNKSIKALTVWLFIMTAVLTLLTFAMVWKMLWP